MSARSDILGWVIRRLTEVDAADPAARNTLFDSLRADVTRDGFGTLPPEEALPHLESAIARQEVYWLSQQPPGLAAKASPPDVPAPSPSMPSKPVWGWRRFLPVPPRPPGPPPGESTGPFADHVYETVPLLAGRGQAECRLSWAYDPACRLTAHCPDIGFRFETRASSFRHAADHLGAVLRRGGLTLPVAAFAPGAVWADDAPDGETVRIGQSTPVHAFTAGWIL
ncbi:MAG TPA: hypothetical protein PK417_00940 [Hyphomonas sp.]|nr:hypothetical protein [Hyphomonas sp.]HRX72475.1 hypothetical protein [Hyphomonas sp.]